MRLHRRKLNKTLDEMAEITGLAKATLWELENREEVDPRLQTVKRVCWAYRIGISRITVAAFGSSQAEDPPTRPRALLRLVKRKD